MQLKTQCIQFARHTPIAYSVLFANSSVVILLSVKALLVVPWMHAHTLIQLE